MLGGRPRRFALGEEARRAQSRGEWPGVRRTFLRGLEGGAECVGGSVRDEELVVVEGGPRLGRREEREGGAIRPACCGCA